MTFATIPEPVRFGPTSPWPRKRPAWKRNAGFAALIAGLGIFAHCGLPVLF